MCILLARLVGDQGLRRFNLDCGLSADLIEHEEKRFHALLTREPQSAVPLLTGCIHIARVKHLQDLRVVARDIADAGQRLAQHAHQAQFHCGLVKGVWDRSRPHIGAVPADGNGLE